MKLTFIGADHEVTGSCHYLEIAGKRLTIDCGLEQGADIYENEELPCTAADLDYVFLTHAHIDHSGYLPSFTHTDSVVPFLQPKQPRIYARSCYVIVLTFRRWKQNGRIEKPDVPVFLK